MVKSHWHDRVRKYEADGQHDRARDLALNAVRDSGYSSEDCLVVGRMLESFGDDLEAGRFLFLGGADDARARECIDLFLGRYDKVSATELIGLLTSGRTKIFRVAWFCSISLKPERMRYRSSEKVLRWTARPIGDF